MRLSRRDLLGAAIALAAGRADAQATDNGTVPTGRYLDVDEKRWMKSIANDFGIVFLYSGTCPYCQAQVPVLNYLIQETGINILGISIDKTPLPGFKNTRSDNGLVGRMTGGRGVEVTPMIFLVERASGNFLMIGTGYMPPNTLFTAMKSAVV